MTKDKIEELRQKFYKECTGKSRFSESIVITDGIDTFQWFLDNFKRERNEEVERLKKENERIIIALRKFVLWHQDSRDESENRTYMDDFDNAVNILSNNSNENT